jgi:hypothetical protein
MQHLSLAAVMVSFCAASAALADTAPRIGTAAVVTNAVTGAIKVTQRDLRRGDGVFQDEKITTGANSGAQLLFRDETALTMGADSQVILDKLIYDPDRRTGEMALRAIGGAFRFVSGSGPKQGYNIQTALGTIGVRGTIIQFWIRAGQIILQLDEGGAVFCAHTRCVGLDKPGTYVVATAQHISAPQSKYGECGASGGSTPCQITGKDDTLFLQFLDRRTFNDISPSTTSTTVPPPPNNQPPAPPTNPPPSPAVVPQSKFGVPYPPSIANLAFGVPLPPATPNNAPAPTPSAAPLTKYGVPLPPAIANRVYNLPQK